MAHKSGEPFASAVFEIGTNRLIAVGVSQVVPGCNSAQHAEMVAVMLGQDALKNYRFPSGRVEYGLFSSCDPYAMCIGAIHWSGVRRLVRGAAKEDAHANGFGEGPVFLES